MKILRMMAKMGFHGRAHQKAEAILIQRMHDQGIGA